MIYSAVQNHPASHSEAPSCAPGPPETCWPSRRPIHQQVSGSRGRQSAILVETWARPLTATHRALGLDKAVQRPTLRLHQTARKREGWCANPRWRRGAVGSRRNASLQYTSTDPARRAAKSGFVFGFLSLGENVCSSNQLPTWRRPLCRHMLCRVQRLYQREPTASARGQGREDLSKLMSI